MDPRGSRIVRARRGHGVLIVLAAAVALVAPIGGAPASAQDAFPERWREAYPAPRYSLHWAAPEIVLWKGRGREGMYLHVVPDAPISCPNVRGLPHPNTRAFSGFSIERPPSLEKATADTLVTEKIEARPAVVRPLGEYRLEPFPTGYLQLFEAWLPAGSGDSTRSSIRGRIRERRRSWGRANGDRWILVVDHQGTTSLRRCPASLGLSITLPEHPDGEVPLGEPFRALVTVSATAGEGVIRSITFDSSTILDLGEPDDPDAAFTLASGPGPPSFTLAPGGEQTFELSLVARRPGNARLPSAVTAVDGQGGSLRATADRRVRVVGEALHVSLGMDPRSIELEEGEDGEPVPKDVTLTVTVTNRTGDPVTDVAVQGVTRFARDRSRLAARVQVVGRFPLVVGNGRLGAAGTRESSASVPITVRAHRDGRFEFQVLVTGAVPDGLASVQGVARGGRLDVNAEYLVEFELEVPREAEGVTVQDVTFREGMPVIVGGRTLLLLGTLRNLTSNSTVIVDGLPATIARNALGGDFSQLAICPPPTPELELGPNHSETLAARIGTTAEGPPRAVVTWPWPSGTVRDDATGEQRALAPEDVRITVVAPLVLAETDTELRLDAIVDQTTTPQGRLDPVARWGHFTQAAMEGVGHWAYSSFDAVGAIGRGLGRASNLTLGELVRGLGEAYVHSFVTAAELITEFHAWTKDHPEEFDEWALQVAMTLLGRPDYLVESLDQALADVRAVTMPLFESVEAAYAANDDREVARLLGSISGNVVAEVSTCLIPTAEFARAIQVSSLAKADEAARLAATATTQERYLRAVPSGARLGAPAVGMWGIAEETLLAIQEVARHFGVMIVPRERSLAATRLIDELGIAIWKPELMKPKSLGEVDRYLKGILHERGDAYQGYVAIFLPDPDDVIIARLRADGVPEEAWPLVLERAASQRSDFHEYLPLFEEWRERGIDVGFNYADNGLPLVGGNPRALRGFDVTETDGLFFPQMADLSGAMKWISGDIDIVDIRFLDGSPLDSRTAVLVYRELARVAGIQHPHLMTWIKDGQTVFRAKVNQFKDYITRGKALLQIAPDAVRAVRINEGLSYLAAAGTRHRIWYDGGIKTLGAPLFDVGPFRFVGRYRPGILTPLPYPAAIGWTVGADCAWEPTDQEAPGVVRADPDGDGFQIHDGEGWRPHDPATCGT